MTTRRVSRQIGPDDAVPVHTFFRSGETAAKAVALVDRDGNPATAFLIAEDLAMTNHHVFPDAAAAERVTLRFNYDDAQRKPVRGEVHRLAPKRYFHTNEELDYTIVAVTGRPGRQWGFVDLNDWAAVAVGDDVFVVEHPEGKPQQIVPTGNTVTYVEGHLVRYTADTAIGSSGSPVFGRNWHLAALHHWGDVEFNEGISASAIAADWPGR
jgi:V8-like Glu-specific endopeptidase